MDTDSFGSHPRDSKFVYSENAAEEFQQRRTPLALFAIGSFVTIFIVGILWATSRKADEHHH
jgi:hypothetical protein